MYPTRTLCMMMCHRSGNALQRLRYTQLASVFGI